MKAEPATRPERAAAPAAAQAPAALTNPALAAAAPLLRAVRAPIAAPLPPIPTRLPLNLNCSKQAKESVWMATSRRKRPLWIDSCAASGRLRFHRHQVGFAPDRALAL